MHIYMQITSQARTLVSVLLILHQRPVTLLAVELLAKLGSTIRLRLLRWTASRHMRLGGCWWLCYMRGESVLSPCVRTAMAGWLHGFCVGSC